jgi:hypothetical protein
MKTRAEVDDLKAQWKADPCWDIEDTEGFEEYRAELFDWRIAYNDEIRHQKHLRILNFAQRYDVPIGIADYILTLEARIARLEGKE